MTLLHVDDNHRNTCSKSYKLNLRDIYNNDKRQKPSMDIILQPTILLCLITLLRLIFFTKIREYYHGDSQEFKRDVFNNKMSIKQGYPGDSRI